MSSKLISKKAIDFLNVRIKQEEESSRLYEQIALYFDDEGYFNLAKLYRQYSAEEMTHADWAKQYLLDFGLTPKLSALQEPHKDYKTPKEIFALTVEHEEFITTEINKIAVEALQENDFVLFQLANRYQTEQQEEIGKAIDLQDIEKLTKDGLLLDHYVGEHILEE